MNRLARNIITGGIIATAAGMYMRRSPRNMNMMNRSLNMLINTMGRFGVFRFIGRSRFFRNMVRAR